MTEPARRPSLGELHWKMIVLLAVLGLIRPALNILGVYDTLGTTWLPVIVTVLISVLWVTTVVLRRSPQPLLTLVITGTLYGVLAIALNRAVEPFLADAPAPMPGPTMASIVLTNLIWGALLGLIALGIVSLRRRTTS